MISSGILESEAENKEVKKNLSYYDRIRICRYCPLFIEDLKVCNPNKWMNRTTGEVSDVRKDGYTKGCGCLVERKAAQPNKHCSLGKW